MLFTTHFSRELPGLARGAAAMGFMAPGVLCFYRDTHGPPLLIGAWLAVWMTKWWPASAPGERATLR
jgi:hypothetical protein